MNKKPLLALFGTILLLLGGYVFLRHSSNPPGSLPNTGNSAGSKACCNSPPCRRAAKLPNSLCAKPSVKWMPTMRKAIC